MEYTANTYSGNLGAATPAEQNITAKAAAQKAQVPFPFVMELIRSGEVLSCTYLAKHWVSPASVQVIKEFKQEKISKYRRHTG